MWLPHWAFYEGSVGDQPEIQWIIVMMYSTVQWMVFLAKFTIDPTFVLLLIFVVYSFSNLQVHIGSQTRMFLMICRGRRGQGYDRVCIYTKILYKD